MKRKIQWTGIYREIEVAWCGRSERENGVFYTRYKYLRNKNNSMVYRLVGRDDISCDPSFKITKVPARSLLLILFSSLVNDVMSASGLYCGMYISEFEEALYYDFLDAESEWITESNNEFSTILSKHIYSTVHRLIDKYANTRSNKLIRRAIED